MLAGSPVAISVAVEVPSGATAMPVLSERPLQTVLTDPSGRHDRPGGPVDEGERGEVADVDATVGGKRDAGRDRVPLGEVCHPGDGAIGVTVRTWPPLDSTTQRAVPSDAATIPYHWPSGSTSAGRATGLALYQDCKSAASSKLPSA